mgnify:CR=1 FL=1
MKRIFDNIKLDFYWNDIPVGKNNAITYTELMERWSMKERSVRAVLHDLSSYDNGDDYILVRSGSGKGFYKTDNPTEIEMYKNECLNKGRSVFAPIKKINRVMNTNAKQINFENNMRGVRESLNLTQREVCRTMQMYDTAIDSAMLSKMENGVCLPTPYQLSKFAEMYGCEPAELIKTDLYL